MTLDQWLLATQIGAVVATVAAVLVALQIGKRDREAADQRAAEDRRIADRRAEGDRQAAREDSQRRFEHELLVRLLINILAPGTSGNPENDRRRQRNAERRGIIAMFGPERLPVTWASLAGRDLEKFRQVLESERDVDLPPHERETAEIVLELDRLRRMPGEHRGQ